MILFPLRMLSYAILAVGLWQLLRPVLRERADARGERERAAEIVRRYGQLSTAYFARGEDKRYVWSDSGQTLLPYRVVGGVALALSDPIGPVEEHPQTLAKFIAYCQRRDWAFGIYQASPIAYRLGRGQGLRGFKIGEDALVDLRCFTLAGKAGAAVRHSVARAQRGGLTVQLFHGECLPDAIVAGMERVSTTWLRQREINGQFGFSMGRFPADWSPEMLTAVAVDPNGAVQAFVTWTPLYAAQGWSLDLIRRDADATGTMDTMDRFKVAVPDCLSTLVFDGAVSSFSTVHRGSPLPVNVMVQPLGFDPIGSELNLTVSVIGFLLLQEMQQVDKSQREAKHCPGGHAPGLPTEPVLEP
jgi:phosphatidylglycerol lysyltransferase